METAHPDEDVECGGIAQLVERVVRNDEARGSNPLTSTNFALAKSNRFQTETHCNWSGARVDGSISDRRVESIFYGIFRFCLPWDIVTVSLRCPSLLAS